MPVTVVLVLGGRSRENKAQWRLARGSQYRLRRRGRAEERSSRARQIIQKLSQIKLQVPHMQEARFNSRWSGDLKPKVL